MTESEMRRMEQEAIRRAQEMHRRATRRQRDDENEKPAQKAPESVYESEQSTETAPPVISSRKKEQGEGEASAGGIFEMLFKDREKTLILGIILLLMDEKTDNSLIMALMYLLI